MSVTNIFPTVSVTIPTKSDDDVVVGVVTFPGGIVILVVVVKLFDCEMKAFPPIDKYLYDTVAYDSPLEKENILASIDEIVVFGKIPRNSISIPTIGGGTYSPDFMYVVKKNNGDKTLNIVVETKDVQSHADLRGVEEMKIKCAEVFFNQLTIEGYKVEFHKQLSNQKIKQIIDEVLLNEN